MTDPIKITISANADCVWVTRLDAETEKGGILIPDAAKPKVNKGLIVTVGEIVTSIKTSKVRVGRIAIFNKTAGFEITEEGIKYTILRLNDIIGTDHLK
jgi:co-chaperonin GroES (HSP10)